MEQKLPADTIQLLQEASNRAALAARLGYQYGGDRDIYQALGYKTDLDFNDYATQYDRQDVAKAIINRPVSKTWQGQLQVLEMNDDKTTPFEKAYADLDRKLKFKHKFMRLDKLACLGEYAVMVIGFSDVQTLSDMKNKVAVNSKVVYLKPYSQQNAKINRYVTSATDPRYGLPEIYDINVAANNGEDITTGQTVQVHHSRVIHVTVELLDSEVKGIPTLKAVFNRLKDLEKIVGGSAEMFWRGARPGYQAVVKEDYQMGPDDEDKLQTQINEYEHNLRRMLFNEGVEMKEMGTQVSSPKEHVDIQIQMISAITGIPKRILTGSERGELSSNQDEDAWLSIITNRRLEYAEPVIIRQLVDRLMEFGVLPKVEKYEVQWSDLFGKSAKELAEIGKTRATAIKEYLSQPGAEMILPPDAFLEYVLGMTPEQIILIKEMIDNMEITEQNEIEEAEEIIPMEE